MTDAIVEHFFRHEYGKLIAVLSRKVGVQYLALVEDAVQFALLAGVEVWARDGQPENPSAWLYRVAHNQLLSELRQRQSRERILTTQGTAFEEACEDDDVLLTDDFSDDMLRMLFVCCRDEIPHQSKLILALKILCGFSIQEIALRLFLTEANVYKRYSRAKKILQATPNFVAEDFDKTYVQRIPAVHKVLYLLFTEGYLSSRAEYAVRLELCDEAVRLTTMLANHRYGKAPESFALLALMYLHLARMASRQDDAGSLLLLHQQDRSMWSVPHIQQGLHWLEKSANGNVFSRYHAEAGIAAEHCMAPSFSATRWDNIASCYQAIEAASPSPLHRLNRAIAIAELQGPEAGLKLLQGYSAPAWLLESFHWNATLADLQWRAGNREVAERYRQSALKVVPNEAQKNLMLNRWRMLDGA